jgi:hypothetical protein
MRFILAVAVWSAGPVLAQVQPEAGGNLLLRDYKPRTALVVKQTRIQHAKYPVIDVHFHMDYKADPARVVQTMDEVNLQMVVSLGTGDQFGDTLTQYVNKWVTPYSSRFATMANLNEKRINDADFGQKAVAQLREDVKNGAIALKISSRWDWSGETRRVSSSGPTIRALTRSGMPARTLVFPS